VIDPEAAESLFRAGTGVMLVLLVITILAGGAREIWVWGAAYRRALSENAALRVENAELRSELGANTKAMGTMSADFVKALGELRSTFEHELEDLTDELRFAGRRGGPDAP
jgi:hypothetical protein